VARWYVEARDTERWREVSELFGQWIDRLGTVKTFGWSEGDSLTVSGTTFLCFDFPDHHGEKIALFGSWAATTGRLFGEARSGRLRLTNKPDVVVLLPPEKVVPPPPWLR
jgi:hypothetical protein